ncbi:MAG: PEP-CTERM sorting domain-containing protein [Microcoleaceae cyanobacterium]
MLTAGVNTVINRIQKLSIACLSALFCVGSIAATAEAASFVAETRGLNNGNDSDFFSFRIDDTGDTSDVFIKSIQIDLAAGGDSDAYFDFQSFAPTLNLASLQGISESDITFTSLAGSQVVAPGFNPDDGDTSLLQISFAFGSFGIGDSFQFGADTDNLANDRRDDGDDFARAGAALTLELEDGTFETVSFSEVENNYSQVIQSIANAADIPDPVTEVPEPLSIFGLFTVGILGSASLKRSKSV